MDVLVTTGLPKCVRQEAEEGPMDGRTEDGTGRKERIMWEQYVSGAAWGPVLCGKEGSRGRFRDARGAFFTCTRASGWQLRKEDLKSYRTM